MIERDSNGFNDKIGMVAVEIKKLERKSKIYLEIEIKEEINLKKSRTEAVLKRFKDELQVVENFRKNEESMASFVRKKLEEKKSMIDGLRNKKGEFKAFLATQKLASEKKNGSMSPVKGREFKVWSPKKNKRTRSTLKNK